MKLWLLKSGSWDLTFTVVRAETEARAREMVICDWRAEVVELSTDGPEGTIWEYVDSGPRSE